MHPSGCTALARGPAAPGYVPDMQDDRNTPGPEGPATRQVVAWTLIGALALAAPASLLAGAVDGGGRLVLVAVTALVLVGGVAAWLHARSRRE